MMSRDPDVERLEEAAADPATTPEGLGTDSLRPEQETLEYEPPDELPRAAEPETPRSGRTTIDERVEQEEPEEPPGPSPEEELPS
jgi:hypothetical protein